MDAATHTVAVAVRWSRDYDSGFFGGVREVNADRFQFRAEWTDSDFLGLSTPQKPDISDIWSLSG